MAVVSVATDICNWARWAVAHQPWFFYEEERPFPLYQPTATRPIYNDCSASVALYYWLAGAPDPMGMNYDGFGNTDTLAGRGEQISESEAMPGDVVIYGDPTVHGALVIASGADPLTVSHGDPSQPAYSGANEGCPPAANGVIRFYRFNTTKPAPVPPPAPTPMEEPMWLDHDPNNGGAILVCPAQGGFYGLVALTNTYLTQNKVGTAPHPITKAEFKNLKQLGTL